MTSIPIGQSVLKRLDNDPIYLINMFYEDDPTNQVDNVCVTSRPGLTQFKITGLGTEGTRGLYRQDGAILGFAFTVYTTTLYKMDCSGATGSVTNIGAIPKPVDPTISSRVVMAGITSYVLIATGEGLYSTDGATVAAVVFPDGASVLSVESMNDYFLAIRSGSQKCYFSAVGGITFDPLDFFSAESGPDNLLNVIRNGDELWLFGQATVEVYVPSGDPDAPFTRIQGRAWTMGLASRDAATLTTEGIAWVGQDRTVYHSGSQPVAISSDTVDQKLTRSILDAESLPVARSDLTMWSYTFEGKVVVLLNVGDTITYAFNGGRWTQYRGLGLNYWPLWNGCRLTDGRFIVADLSAAKIWKLDPDEPQDYQTPVSYEFTGVLDGVSNPIRCDTLVLDCAVGQGSDGYTNPVISLRMSDDRGQTWSTWIDSSLGAKGAYSWLPAWTRLGLIRRPGRLFHWRTQTSGMDVTTARFTVRRISMNESIR